MPDKFSLLFRKPHAELNGVIHIIWVERQNPFGEIIVLSLTIAI